MDDKKSKKTRPEKKAARSATTKTAVRATKAPKKKPKNSNADNAAGVPVKSKEAAARAKDQMTPPAPRSGDQSKDEPVELWDKSQRVIDETKDKNMADYLRDKEQVLDPYNR